MSRVIENFTVNSYDLINLDNKLHDRILHRVDDLMDIKNFPKADTNGDIEETYTIVYSRTYNKGKS